MAKSVGERAKEIRINKGLKQSFVAHELGFKRSSSLSDIESGRTNISVDKIPLLASILGVSVEELFFDNKNRDSRSAGTA